MTKDAINTLCRHVVETRFEEIPVSAIDAARTFLLDSLGVGIAGSRGPFVEALIAAHDSQPCARVLGHRQRVSPSASALINAYQIHNSEFDCVHEAAVVHPMAVLLGAVLGWLDDPAPKATGHVSGRDLLGAVVLGVDVACHLGVASRSPLRFFRPATAGAFAATAALGRLSGFDSDRLVDAMGLNLAQLCGTMQAHTEGSPALALQVGFNARNALLARDLAARGVTGPRHVLQGPFGYLALFEGDSRLDEVLPEVGRVWRITEVAHKPFPSGRATHGIVELCLDLASEHGIRAERIERVSACVPPLTHRLVGRPAVPAMAVSYARLCAAFVAARALIGGGVGLEDFSSDARSDAATLDLAQRIQLQVQDSSDPNALTPVTVSILLRDGTVVRGSTDVVLGNPAKGLTRQAHLEKFRRNWRASAQPLSEDMAERVIDTVDRLDEVGDIQELLDALAVAP